MYLDHENDDYPFEEHEDVEDYEWIQCYWCDYWVQGGYICDYRVQCGLFHRLCGLCYDWHIGQGQFRNEAQAVEEGGLQWVGGPYEPTAITRTSRLLLRLFPLLAEDALRVYIAEYLVSCFAP
jgi:hypothetical protein